MDFLNIVKRHKIVFIAYAATVISLTSCSIKYSMNGASISPELKTVSVAYFQNQAPTVLPTLNQQLTESLRDKCRNQTRLTLLNENGDVTFEGEIVGYDTRPTAIQSSDIAAKNRFTIRVKVRYTNIVDSKLNFEQTFERYTDFNGNQTLSEIENDGKTIKDMVDLLTEDIFNKAFVNW
jgi:hypothetical protein